MVNVGFNGLPLSFFEENPAQYSEQTSNISPTPSLTLHTGLLVEHSAVEAKAQTHWIQGAEFLPGCFAWRHPCQIPPTKGIDRLLYDSFWAGIEYAGEIITWLKCITLQERESEVTKLDQNLDFA